MKILIHPWARALRNGNENPKNYPFWKELIAMMPEDWSIIQIGTPGEKKLVEDFRTDLTLKELVSLLKECDSWIGVDSFFQHLAWKEGKKGFVIFSQTDPRIFGHLENYNFYNPKYLMKNQFQTWEEAEYIKEAFPEPETVLSLMKEYLLPPL